MLASAATGTTYRDPNDRPGTNAPGESPFSPPRQEERSSFWRRARVRNWRVRSKLIAVVLVPTIATVALAGVSIARSVGDARSYDRVAKLAALGRQVTPLVHELQQERDLSSGFIASGKTHFKNEKNAQRERVDQSVADYRRAADQIDASYSDSLAGRFATATGELGALRELRKAVDNSGLTRASILAQYSATISALLDLDASIAENANDRDFADSVRVLDELSRAKEFTSEVRAQLYGVLTASFPKDPTGAEHNQGSFAVGQFEEFVGATSREQSAIDQFRSDAPADVRALYADTVRGPRVSAAKTTQDTAIRQARSVLTLPAADWYNSQKDKIDRTRQVETTLLDRVISRANALRSNKQQDGIVAAAVLLGVLLLAGAATIVMARAMTKPLRILRSSALEVADHRLPEVINRLRQADAGNLDDIRVEPTGIESGDEIGEVAQAFDAVHREAVRLAVDQASLRQSVNAMFVNLSRRSQGLVERQLRLIDELESSEQNPDQLENLFKLDHLATRMRRNDDSLLVLAGSETGRGWNAPMSLPDVVLASISEVEQYTRITRTTVTEAGLVGYVVSDVVHLLAELMENATAFSPPETAVTVSSRRLSGRGGAMIEIEDHGIGMTPEELDSANARLAAPPIIDVAVVRTMGLFVVGRLANKHNIRVQLRNSPRSGVTALVLLPPSLITDLNSDGSGDGDNGAHLGSHGAFESEQAFQQQGGYHNGMAGAVGTDTGPLNLEPSPIFDSVSEWFRHRRRIDHEAVQENGTAAPKRGPAGGRPPAAPPPQQRQQGRPAQPPAPPQPQRRPAPLPQQPPPPQPPTPPQQQRRQAPVPTERPSPPPQTGQPGGHPGGLPRRGPARRQPNPPSGPPAATRPPTAPPTAPPAEPVPPRLPAPMPGRSAPPPPIADESWSTPADAGWRAAEATSTPSYDRTTRSGLPVRTPRAHLFPGSAATAREERQPTTPKPTGGRSPDSVRSVLSTYYSSYKRGRTDEGDLGPGRHRANFGFPASPDEQEGS